MLALSIKKNTVYRLQPLQIIFLILKSTLIAGYLGYQILA
jgi:hypothetical protein